MMQIGITAIFLKNGKVSELIGKIEFPFNKTDHHDGFLTTDLAELATFCHGLQPYQIIELSLLYISDRLKFYGMFLSIFVVW
jgi:hypothetical protein